MDKGRARRLRRDATDAERTLWRALRDHQLAGFQFRRQQIIGPYVVDFYCSSGRLVIEVDGGQHARRIDEDRQRTEWLESQELRVLRFWNNQVLSDLEGVLVVIGAALEDTAPIVPIG